MCLVICMRLWPTNAVSFITVHQVPFAAKHARTHTHTHTHIGTLAHSALYINSGLRVELGGRSHRSLFVGAVFISQTMGPLAVNFNLITI